MSPATDLHALWVLLGRAASQPVPDTRKGFYRWLGKQLRPGDIELRGPGQSKSLTFEQVRTDAASASRLLREDVEPAEDAVIVIDLSQTAYDLLREPFLLHVGQAAMEFADLPERTVALLLPGNAPARGSLLWLALDENDGTPSGSLLVLDHNGIVESIGAKKKLPANFARDFRKRSSRLDASVNDRFESKLLRRLGHFDLGALSRRADKEVCSHHLFDAEGCVEELASLLERQLSGAIRKGERAKWMLVSCGSRSGWTREATMLAADLAGIDHSEWPKRPTKIPPKEFAGRRLALLFDVVRSGETARAALEKAKDWHGVQVRLLFSAVGPNQTVRKLPGGLKLQPMAERHLERVPRSRCPQCELGLPFSDPELGKELAPLRAFDLWSMLLDVDWLPERYGPKNAEFFKSSPDFESVFKNYGDFLAYRYELLLNDLDDNELVVASPDEPAVGELVRRLSIRFDDRIVWIGVPREPILECVREDGSEAAVKNLLAKHAEEAWARQLANVREREESVVMIDEFNGSGTTAQAMANLLKGAHVPVRGFLPVVDRRPDVDLGPIPIHPLYEIPRPRR